MVTRVGIGKAKVNIIILIFLFWVGGVHPLASLKGFGHNRTIISFINKYLYNIKKYLFILEFLYISRLKNNQHKS